MKHQALIDLDQCINQFRASLLQLMNILRPQVCSSYKLCMWASRGNTQGFEHQTQRSYLGLLGSPKHGSHICVFGVFLAKGSRTSLPQIPLSVFASRLHVLRKVKRINGKAKLKGMEKTPKLENLCKNCPRTNFGCTNYLFPMRNPGEGAG